MRINEHVVVCTSKIVLVPYSKHHVPIYHDWMKDPDIQAATASEPLTLEEEYAMQQGWRIDADKLTFILCIPPVSPDASYDHTTEIMSMIGDVNMFISIYEHEDGRTSLVGELELMIALKTFQRRGLGRAALLTFLRYVLEHESEIINQFTGGNSQNIFASKFDFLIAKIKDENERSLRLFETIGFQKTSTVPNFFNEFELRHAELSLEIIKKMMTDHDIESYYEGIYSEATI